MTAMKKYLGWKTYLTFKKIFGEHNGLPAGRVNALLALGWVPVDEALKLSGDWCARHWRRRTHYIYNHAKIDSI